MDTDNTPPFTAIPWHLIDLQKVKESKKNMIQPTEGRLLVRPAEQKEASEILWTPVKDGDWQIRRMEVVYVGPSHMAKTGPVPSDIKPGNFVLHQGVARDIEVEEERLLLINERDIIGVEES